MTKKARDVMTPDPACCTPGMSVDEVAQLMIQNDCGEIPVIDTDDRLIGVVTDRDIVCRVVAEGKNPVGHTVETCMSQPVVTVSEDTSLDEVIATMERHQIRRVPVVADVVAAPGSSLKRTWRETLRSMRWRSWYAASRRRRAIMARWGVLDRRSVADHGNGDHVRGPD
jgi:CBS domain-containing protein